MFPLRIELRTFRVLSGCDNHYTTETADIHHVIWTFYLHFNTVSIVYSDIYAYPVIGVLTEI